MQQVERWRRVGAQMEAETRLSLEARPLVKCPTESQPGGAGVAAEAGTFKRICPRQWAAVVFNL